MKAYLESQDLWDLSHRGSAPQNEEGMFKAQRDLQQATKRRIKNALSTIHRDFDDTIFQNLSNSTSSKQACGILQNIYEGANKVKKISSSTFRGKYEVLSMKESE